MPDWPTLSVHYYADERFETGIRNVQEGKNQFRIYDIEKTVVDIVFSLFDGNSVKVNSVVYVRL